jgi:hypothetical protein
MSSVDAAVLMDGFVGGAVGAAVTGVAVWATLKSERRRAAKGRVIEAAAEALRTLKVEVRLFQIIMARLELPEAGDPTPEHRRAAIDATDARAVAVSLFIALAANAKERQVALVCSMIRERLNRRDGPVPSWGDVGTLETHVLNVSQMDTTVTMWLMGEPVFKFTGRDRLRRQVKRSDVEELLDRAVTVGRAEGIARSYL